MWSINYKFITRVVGLMCMFEVIVFILCLGIAVIYNEDIMPTLISSAAFALVGGLLYALSRRYSAQHVGPREGMLTVTLTWLTLSLIGTLPFMLSGSITSFIDAFFETISGFTTTGATIFVEVENLPKNILFWRSIIQWQGGIGIVVFTVAVLPLLGGGVSKLYDAETTGIIHDRFMPRITQVVKRIFVIYMILTSSLVLLLWLGPMNLYDSVCHAFTCVSTGGFSTRNDSIASFNSPYAEYLLSFYMFLGSLSLTLLYFAILARKPLKLIKDEEAQWYVGFLVVCTVGTTLWLYYHNDYPTFESNFRHALFQVCTLFSSTGYLTANIELWRPFFWSLAIAMMAINGCAGSTCGGLKTGRFVILMKNLGNEFTKRVKPNQVVQVTLKKKVISISIVHQVLAFTFLYFSIIIGGSMLLMLDDCSFSESISATTSAISNSGPALGAFTANFATAGTFSKLVLCFVMLAGRLEVFTVITLLTPAFWRR